MNITLIGMAGAGKSVIGKELANRLGYSFIDIDTVIEDKYKNKIQTLIDDLGDEKVLEIEREEIMNINSENSVISPGGSVIYVSEAMEHLKSISKIIYLEVPLEVILQRIYQKSRGIVGIKEKSLQEIFDERVSLYKKYADIVIQYRENFTVVDYANEIKEKIL